MMDEMQIKNTSQTNEVRMQSSDIKSNAHEYSVAELSFALKRNIEENFGRVRIRGELSSAKIAASGHGYFTLKDTLSNDVLDGVCWRSTLAKLAFRPEEGMEIIASGALTTYGDRSKYQLIISTIELAGQGALLQQFEALKRKLASEGLFEEGRKQPLPYLPQSIGVITSPTGAVIRDILHRLLDRFPTHVLLWPSLVQGQYAAEQLTQALQGMNALPNKRQSYDGVPIRPDLIILARGGGSLEDLWAFNDENLVRAIHASTIPVISAVGHESDFTLCDFVADKRAPTPTAAAEFAVPVRQELLIKLDGLKQSMTHSQDRYLTHKEQLLTGWGKALLTPARQIGRAEQRLDERFERCHQAIHSLQCHKTERLQALTPRLETIKPILLRTKNRLDDMAERLPNIVKTSLRRAEQDLQTLSDRLEANSFKAILNRGYAVIYDEHHQLVTRPEKLKKDQKLVAEFKDELRLPLKVDDMALKIDDMDEVNHAIVKR